jgi:hypothetical protein
MMWIASNRFPSGVDVTLVLASARDGGKPIVGMPRVARLTLLVFVEDESLGALDLQVPFLLAADLSRSGFADEVRELASAFGLSGMPVEGGTFFRWEQARRSAIVCRLSGPRPLDRHQLALPPYRRAAMPFPREVLAAAAAGARVLLCDGGPLDDLKCLASPEITFWDGDFRRLHTFSRAELIDLISGRPTLLVDWGNRQILVLPPEGPARIGSIAVSKRPTESVGTLLAAMLNSRFLLRAGATIDARDLPGGIDPTGVLPKRWRRLRAFLCGIHPDADFFLPAGKGGRRTASPMGRLRPHQNYLLLDSDLVRAVVGNPDMVRLWEEDRTQ